MTLNDVERALERVLNARQLGTPVALRIHALVPGFAGDTMGVLGSFAPIARLISAETAGKVQARRHPSGLHLSVLWTSESGVTVFISLGTAPAARQSLEVLLVGNHGTTTLTGGEAWEEELPPDVSPLWKSEIEQSLERGTSIPVGAS